MFSEGIDESSFELKIYKGLTESWYWAYITFGTQG